MVIKFLFKILMLKIEKTENKMSIGSDYVSDPISSLEGWLEVSGTLYLVGEWSNGKGREKASDKPLSIQDWGLELTSSRWKGTFFKAQLRANSKAKAIS